MKIIVFLSCNVWGGMAMKLFKSFVLPICLLCGPIAFNSSVAAETLKPRVLVIPFDNMMGDKNYEWMKGSISDNLKEKLINTEQFDVIDVHLLRQINPDIKFSDLTEKEVTPLARKLNCEAAIIGRYITKKKDDSMKALIQVEAVNAVSNESILIKSEYANLDGTIFTNIEKLAATITDEFIEKLPPVDSEENTRSDELEKIIRRLQHPPKGFFDTLSFELSESDKKNEKYVDEKIILEPEFDIDTFEYELYLPEGVLQIAFKYDIWGRTFKPYVTIDSGQCKTNACDIKKDETEILISKTKDRTTETEITDKEKNKPEKPVIYKIRVYREPPPGPVFGRWWVSMGYPYMKSFSFISPDGNPDSLSPGGAFPFDAMAGVFSLETGFAPGRWQLPAGMNYSIAAQFQYGKGEFKLDSQKSLTAAITLFSMGGGIRIDRPFMIANFYGVSPMIGFYSHYQIFNYAETSSSFTLTGLNPEAGFIQYFKMGKESNWKISLTTVFGSYLYKNQNLSYIRANVGVEYAVN